jgi:hypothetical protein
MAFPGADGEVLPDIDRHEEQYDIISYELEPGDMLVHGSAGNTTLRQTRRAASLRYCGDDIRFKFRPYAPAQAHFHHQLKDGDPLDCAQFPVVWPAGTGCLPPREAELGVGSVVARGTSKGTPGCYRRSNLRAGR